VRAAAEQVGDELAEIVATRAAQAAGDGMIQTIVEEQRALVGAEGPGRRAGGPTL